SRSRRRARIGSRASGRSPMKVGRRARSRPDRAGDPLDGLVNLFDLAIVLAVAFLLAAPASLKLTGLLSQKDNTGVERSAGGRETIIEKHGNQVHVLHVTRQQASGEGVRVGVVYRLRDGRIVYVPQGPAVSAATTAPTPGATTSP